MQKSKSLESLAKAPTKGRVKLLYALPYLKCMVYLMQIDGDIFMSLSVINGQLFHFYLEMLPEKGKQKLNKTQLERTVQILLAGAHTTIEQQLGVKQPETDKNRAKEVINVTERAFGKKGVLN